MIKLIKMILVFTGVFTCSVSWVDDDVSAVQDQPVHEENALIERPSGVSRQLKEDENAYDGRPDMSPFQSLTDWRAQLQKEYSLSLGAHASMLYQNAEETLHGNKRDAYLDIGCKSFCKNCQLTGQGS